MNEILEKILDLIEEMAFASKELESKITGEAEPIILHLIKILKYYDPVNYKKHINDLTKWIKHIRILLSHAKSNISYPKLHKWIILDWIKNEKDCIELEEYLNHDYYKLKIIRTDIYSILLDTLNIITKQIYNNDFKDLQSILKELNIFDEEQYNYISQKRKKRIELNEYN